MSEYLPWAEDPLWYRDAVIYQLHVKALLDSNNDGSGDFRGLAQKLDYIQELGVNALWLLPFYPSPMRDDGYDISDYRNVHPDYGTARDFRRFVQEAHRRGLKVITELVVNHTSDQHPWFQGARQAPPGSAKREFYVWSDTDTKFPETRIIFTDTETSNWAWDPVAKAYYWHRFFSHQPDLNHNNPQVVKAMIRVMRFWLDAGVDGLRLDAIPYLCVREGSNNENLPETHEVIKRMRAEVDANYKNRMFLAEANQWPEDVREYFGEGDECHMAYHFPLMPRMYMAIAREDRHPIVEIMRQTPEIPPNCQWAIFLRNHDELTLEMVTDRERDYMYQHYATEERMRVNVGIRRRLAPLMDNDPGRIKLMNSLLLSMPGSPIIYYGDEIGMGDNIYLGDRNAVRTPMQWSPDRNAGFSRSDPQRLYLPPIMDAIYGYQSVNVEAQSRDPASLLNWMRRVITVRKAYHAFGRGSLRFLRPGNRKILAYLRQYEDENILCIANLAHTAQPVELDLSEFRGYVPMEMMGHIPFPPIGELPYLLTLHPWGVYWFSLAKEGEVPAWHEELPPPIELPVLVISEGIRSFFGEEHGIRSFGEEHERGRRTSAEKLRQQLEREVLPAFMPGQRWFAAKGEPVERFEVDQIATWEEGGRVWLLLWVRLYLASQETQLYFLPLALWWGESEERLRLLLPFTLAKIRQRAKVGVLLDAFADDHFPNALIKAMEAGMQVPCGRGELRFLNTSELAPLVAALPEEAPRRPAAEGSNSIAILSDRIFLKGYRRLYEGVNPEWEIGRFLTESGFPNIIPVLGGIEYHEDGRMLTLGLAQAYVENQGNAWSSALDHLDRFLSEILGKPTEIIDPIEAHAGYLIMMRKLGVRTAQLHQTLSRTTGDPAFDPEPVHPTDLKRWIHELKGDVTKTMNLLRRQRGLPRQLLESAKEVGSIKRHILDRIAELVPAEITVAKIRIHGDYHLGQVLLVENDFLIADFEGEPARTLKERRRKQWALRDVAGMLRSFSYAAYAALYRFTAESPASAELLEPAVLQWERASADAFLEGYREAIVGSPAYPDDPRQARCLIELFTMEKALYELRYELDNRPEWARIPMKGILGLIGANGSQSDNNAWEGEDE